MRVGAHLENEVLSGDRPKGFQRSQLVVFWEVVLAGSIATVIGGICLTLMFWVNRHKSEAARIARKAFSYFKLYNRRALIRYLCDRHIEVSGIEYRAYLLANGKSYRRLSGVELDVESDGNQVSAVEEFRSRHAGMTLAYATMLDYLGEEIPVIHEENTVKCRIYRNNEDRVIVLKDDDIEVLSPTLTCIEDLNMIEHGLEEYVSGSLPDRRQ